ncbi:hypothetical protein [Nocardioides sp.]|uniref:hypothetical protein n=1 Tax=Nocardioides sp. TaxID=35761 RepID=UPI0025CCB76C|nr:hypothetical protein [Nocardioides sp.]
MVTGTREYDLFGPWVDEVRTEDEVPRLYRRHPLDLAAARLVLKVPRDIARRDARPDMDLYDHLVALEPSCLTVLSRSAGAGGYVVRQVAYGDVVAIEDVVTLLDARVRVHARDGEVVTMTYNGADRGHPGRLVEQLRVLAMERSADGEVAAAPGVPTLLDQHALGLDDIGIVNAHRAVAAARPALQAVAWHPRQVVRPGGGGVSAAARSVTHALRPMTVHAALVALDDDTVEVFDRVGLARGRSPVHTQARRLVAREALTEVRVEPHPVYPTVRVVTLVAGQARLTLPVPAGSSTERALAGLRAP